MKHILVPMDFTEISLNAFDYAHHRYPNDQIHAVHINSTIPGRGNKYTEEGLSRNDILTKELKKSIVQKLEQTSLSENIKVEVILGEFLPSIKKYADENDIDFIIMGTRDKHDLIDRWVGTNSLAVVKTMNLPTYLIPRHGKVKDLEQILVASDHHLKDPKVISFIRDWNKEKSSFIKFLHIKSGGEDNFEEEKESIITELFKEGEPDFGFEISSIPSANITDSLLASAYNLGADLMVVFPENMNFMQSLLFRSVSKELIQKSSIPLLFIHA